VDELVSFMRANGIPLTGLDGGVSRVLVIGPSGPSDLSQETAARCHLEFRSAANGFEAGVIAQQFRPHAVVLEVGQEAQEEIGICQNIKSSDSFEDAWVIAACRLRDETREQWLRTQGFAVCLPLPYLLGDLLTALDKLPLETKKDLGRSWRA
jgi:hypothetical protein